MSCHHTPHTHAPPPIWQIFWQAPFFYLEHTRHRQINLTGVLQKVKGRPKLTISLALWATHPNISISSQITAATFSNISNYCRQLPAIRQNSPQCRRPSCSSAGVQTRRLCAGEVLVGPQGCIAGSTLHTTLYLCCPLPPIAMYAMANLHLLLLLVHPPLSRWLRETDQGICDAPTVASRQWLCP